MDGVEVLALIHQADAPPGVFGDVIAERGHALHIHGFATGEPPPREPTDYDAVLVFGGAQQVDEDHEWLETERAFVRDLLEHDVPTLGVCLGSQLVAQVAGGPAGPAPSPEIGWYEVGLTAAASDDPLLGSAPERFAAFQWHSYGFGLPPGAVALAHGPDGALQSCRIGESTWVIQFHAEVTAAIVEDWISEDDGRELPDPTPVRELTLANMPRWNAFGRALCGHFLDYASARSGVAAA
jgi:GMP synthase-like glutamine amidotransferase